MQSKRIFSVLLLSLLLSACHYQRSLKEDDYLLWQSEIVLEDGGRVQYEAENVLRQQANSQLLFKSWRPRLALYHWSKREESLWKRLGEAPVIFDPEQSERSARLLQSYYFNQGYFGVKVETEIEKSRKRDKARARVQYRVTRGQRYRIEDFSIEVIPELASIVEAHREDALVSAGQYYRLDRLNQERRRWRDIFRQAGYYNFSESYLRYEVDTLNKAPGQLALALRIDGIPTRQSDSLAYRKPQKYRLRRVVVRPDYDFRNPEAAQDSSFFRGLWLLYREKKYADRYLWDAVELQPGDWYDPRRVNATYNHLARYNSFGITEITFTEARDSAERPVLDAEIRLVPRPRRTWTTQGEATNTSGNYGVTGSVGIINRNMFGAGEALSFNISSGLEYQPTIGSDQILSRTFELGAELKLDLPRFLLPFNTVGLLPKRMQANSSVSLYANRNSRVEFDRETFGGLLSYRWRESAKKQHRLELLNLSYSRLFSIDGFFRSQLDTIQSLAFQSEFITTTKWDFTYNGQESVGQRHSHFFNSKTEIGGSLQSQLYRWFSAEEESSAGIPSLSGVPIYQFARLELDYRYYFRPSPEHLWVARFNGGYVLPFGLSRLENEGQVQRLPPFSRFFFIGGTNDLRAWPAYRAGGGRNQTSSYEDRSQSNFAIGTFKLLSNFEYRFPIYSILKGALFLDAGNIWLSGGLEDELSGFRLQNLARDLYLGSGLGLRLDLDFFVIRFDTGLRLRDPGYLAQGREWVIATQPVLPNLTYNIALGYPF